MERSTLNREAHATEFAASAPARDTQRPVGTIRGEGGYRQRLDRN